MSGKKLVLLIVSICVFGLIGVYGLIYLIVWFAFNSS